MRILVLSDCYPPEPEVGAFRIRKLARAFSRAGHDVTVVTTRAGGSGSRESDGAVIHVVPAANSPREWVLGARARLRLQKRANAETSAQHQETDEERAQRGWASRLAVGLLNLPDANQGIIPSLVRGAREMHAREPFDLVYSSAPSFSVHIAGSWIARGFNCPWLAEFRDPWRSNGVPRHARMHPWTDRADEWLERWHLKRANTIVAVTESAASHFRRRLGDDDRVIVALNGIEDVRASRMPHDGRSHLRVVYAGSLYAPRDPRPLLTSIARHVARDVNLHGLEIVFIGSCDSYDGEQLDAFAARMGLANFRMIPWVAPEKAQTWVDGADLLLLPAQGWQEQLPNKLFDYLAARVPILAYADEVGETANMLRAVGGHFIATTAGHIDTVVASALEAARHHETVGDPAILHAITVDNQFRHLVASIEKRFDATKVHARSSGSWSQVY